MNNKNIKTRIAPSPTGFLHIGTARAALFNYLFSKSNKGKFILRIEDTDLERSDKKFELDIIKGLEWLNIKWDEGVGVGGDNAPYRQSERVNIYEKYINKLLESDKLYHCFCTEKDLELHRQAMLAEGEPAIYSGKCLSLSKKEVEEKIKNGEKSILRFKSPKENISFNDLIKGKINFNTELIGDIAVAKDLKTPLYNLAVVIDDYEMGISHVLRGDDHISNTPKQIMIMKALGFKMPQYAHFPLVLSPDKRKMSKRDGATSVIEYKKEGYLPEAMVNFLAFLGWNPKDDREIFSLKELENEFKIENIQKSGAIFNIKKLEWFNSYYIKQKSLDDFFDLCLPYLKESNLIEIIDDEIFIKNTKEKTTKQWIKSVLALEKNKIKKLSEISDSVNFLFCDKIKIDNPDILVWKKSDKDKTKIVLEKVISVLDNLKNEKFTSDNIKSHLDNLLKEYGNGDVFWPFRVAVSGKKASPGPLEIAEVLGKDKTLKRLNDAIKIL